MLRKSLGLLRKAAFGLLDDAPNAADPARGSDDEIRARLEASTVAFELLEPVNPRAPNFFTMLFISPVGTVTVTLEGTAQAQSLPNCTILRVASCWSFGGGCKVQGMNLFSSSCGRGGENNTTLSVSRVLQENKSKEKREKRGKADRNRTPNHIIIPYTVAVPRGFD